MPVKYIIDNLGEQTIFGSLSATSFSAVTFYGDGSNLTGVQINPFTGGTVSGETIFDGGISATTLSATTIDLCTSNGTLYTDSISGCSPINILSVTNFNQGLSANTLTASTINATSFIGDGSNLTGVLTGSTTGLTIFNRISGSTISGGTLLLEGRFSVTGSGNTSATTSMYIQNFSGSPLFVINNGGNIGIGTSTPTKKLEIFGGDIMINSVGIGRGSGDDLDNLAIGASALTSNVITPGFGTGKRNIAVGYQSLRDNTTGWQNVAVGYLSMNKITSGQWNVAVGSTTMGQATTRSFSVAIGNQAMSTGINGGNYNTTVGHFSMIKVTTNGDYNSGVGADSFLDLTTGTNNTAIGYRSGNGLATGSNNLFLGYSAGTTASTITNATAIGANTLVNSSNSMVLGNGVNVGIGIFSPTAKLHINNTGSTNTVLFEDETNPDSTPFVITNDGKVGIGVLSPTEKLEISGKTVTTNLRITNPYVPTGSTDPTGSAGDISWSGNNFYWKDSSQWYVVTGSTF